MLNRPETLFGQYARLQLQLISRLASLFIISYLASLVVLAVFRMLTGVSIKRLGYLSLCSVSFHTKQGHKIRIGRIGLVIHRPTVARPGWFEVVVRNAEVQFNRELPKPSPQTRQKNGEKQKGSVSDLLEQELKSIPLLPKSQKGLRRAVKWLIPTLKVVNVTFNSLLIKFSGANFIVSSVSVRLDLRNLQPLRNSNFVGTLDTYKLKHTEIRSLVELNVSEFFVAESLDDENPHPILDSFSFATSGVLDKKSLELKELDLAVNVHNLHLHVGKIIHLIGKGKSESKAEESGTLSRAKRLQLARIGVAIVFLVKELDIKLNSLEVIGIPPSHEVLDKNNDPVSLILSMADVAFNVRRMNPSSPGFKLLYADSPAAHQAFFKVSNVNFGVDAAGVQEELVYIPLVSLLFQTDAAAKTLLYVQDDNAETNNSVINGAFTVNSPTVNIEMHHLPILLQMLHSPRGHAKRKGRSRPNFNVPIEVQNALPRIDLNLHISDAALRLVFEGGENLNSMFITSCSRIHSQLVGEHTTVSEHQVYSLKQEFEVFKCAVVYTSDKCERFMISSSELIALRMSAVTQPELTVKVNVTLSNISYNLTRYELFHAIRSLLLVMRPSLVKGGDHPAEDAPVEDVDHSELKASPIRKIPAWLHNFEFDAENITYVLASEQFRGQTSDQAGVRAELAKLKVKYDIGHGKSTDGRKIHISVEDVALCSINTVHIERPHPESKTVTTNAWLKLPSIKCVAGTATIDDVPQVELFLQIPEVKVIYSMNVFLSLSVVREVLDHAYCRDLLKPKPKQHRHVSEKVSVKAEIEYANLKAHLPNNENLMITVCDGMVEYFPSVGLPRFTCSGVKLYSLYPFNSRAWCVILSLANPNVLFRAKAAANEDQIEVEADCLRANVPFQFKLYRIIDNTITFVKAMATLRMQTLSRDPLLIKQPKVANIQPHIPRVGVRTKSLAMTLEDDPFESDLNLIFQVQKHELEARIHKEIMFEREVKNCLRANGLDIIEQYAQKIADDILHASQSSSVADDSTVAASNTFGGSSKKTTTGTFKHSLTDPFVCRNCKHHKKGKAKSNTMCLFCRNNQHVFGEEGSYTRSVNSTLTDGDDPSNPKEIAKDLRRRIELLLSSPMDLVACEKICAKASKGWSELWTSPEMYPWRQLRINLSSLKEFGILNQLEDVEEGNEDASISLIDARRHLLKHHTDSWIRSINDARNAQVAGVRKTRETQFPDSFDKRTCSEELVVGYSDRPLLFNARFKDIYWRVLPPPLDGPQLRKFMFDIGKGLPMDTKFGIFAPLYFDIEAKGGFDLDLRDYPIPVLSFPPLGATQDPRSGEALKIAGNFIIAEQYSPSNRQVRPLFVPLFPDTPNRQYSSEKKPSWAVVEVHRTLAPVKMYTDLQFVTNSDLPTRFCWCSAYKPAFQNMQNGFAQFSKPPIDLSPVMGFWDKIRLTLHARFKFELKKSSLYFLLKGLRSPYMLHRGGAGFAFAWEKNVLVDINPDDDPKRLFVVRSEVFKTLIPDFTSWDYDYMSRLPGERAFPSRVDLRAINSDSSSKVVMKFSNSTEWVAGMMFQRNATESERKTDYMYERNSNFKPHYEVNLTMPKYVKDKETYDAYHGFRSDYVYMAISVRSLESMGEPGGWNAVHLSPLVIRHFMTWKDQFKNTLWPPTRSGKLFPGETHKKTKLGTVLSGQQYQLALEPLYISFMARHASHRHKDMILAGLKARVDKFILDLHLRKEPIGSKKRWATKLFDGEVTATHTEVRVVAASIRDATVRDARKMRSDSDTDSIFSALNSSQNSSSGNRTTSQSSSHARSNASPRARAAHQNWIDYDDLTDAMSDIHHGTKPKIHLEPFAYTSNLSYRKRTDHSNSKVGEIEGQKYFKFGFEIVHDCLIHNVSPWEGHIVMLKARKKTLEEVMEDQRASVESIESQLQQYPNNSGLLDKLKELNESVTVYKASLSTLDKAIETATNSSKLQPPEEIRQTDRAGILESNSSAEADIYFNIVTVHSLNVKWNNDVRDLVFRLKVLYSGYKEMIYARSRRALRYLEELVQELESRAERNELTRDNLQEVVNGGLENGACSGSKSKPCREEASAGEEIKNFKQNMVAVHGKESAYNSLLVQLIAPQIQVLSNKNPDKCVQIASSAVDVRNVKVYDSYSEDTDFDSAQVESRFGAVLHQANVYVFSKENMARSVLSNLCYAGYVNNSQPEPVGSVSWPPWVGIEFCLDPGVLRQFLLAPKLELAVRYIKLNDQHVICDKDAAETKSSSTEADGDGENITGDSESGDSAKHELSKYKNTGSSRFFVDCPKVTVQCDSVQYYTAYMIAKDLLHYTDPITEDAERAVERVALAIDIAADYRFSLHQVNTLQNNLLMMSLLFDNILASRHSRREESDKDLVKLELDFRRASLDLMVTVRAFKAALRKSNQTDTADILFSAFRFDEAMLTALDDRGKPFMEMSVLNTNMRGLKRGDLYSHTCIKIGLLQGWNLRPDSVYPDIISPHGHFDARKPMAKIEWITSDAVGGIPIVEDVQIHIAPLRVQLEHTLYDTLHKFFLPDDDDNASSVNKGAGADIIGNRMHLVDSDESGSEEELAEANGKATVVHAKKHGRSLGLAKKVGNLMKGNHRHEGELNEIVDRAAKYMNINRFVIYDTGVVVSYKGIGGTALFDVQDVEIKIPELRYLNKLWNKQDIFHRLEKDLIKIVLASSGQILGNMFVRHHKTTPKVKRRLSHNNVLERIGSHTSDFSEVSGKYTVSRQDTEQTNSHLPVISPIEWTESDADRSQRVSQRTSQRVSLDSKRTAGSARIDDEKRRSKVRDKSSSFWGKLKNL